MRRTARGPMAVLTLLGAAAPAAPAAVCPCADLLSALVDKVETNYPGYHLEVRGGPAEAAYQLHLDAMRSAAAAVDAAAAGAGEGVGRDDDGIACVRVLQAFVAWFEDGHLFVGGRPPVRTAEDSARLRDRAPRLSRSEAAVLARLDAGGVLDPVEGIWVDPTGLKLAIVPEGEASYAAIVLESTIDTWEPGDVKAELEALPDGSYDAILYDDARARVRPHVYKRGLAGGARLQRGGLLLHMPPTTWGKMHPVRPGLEGRIDPSDPRAPTARTIGDAVVVFHIPSHVPTHARRLAALVEQYRGPLGRAETLVIDLRGNEGGSTWVTNPLLPYLVTHEEKPSPYLTAGEPAVVASADNVAYFERMSWAPPRLVERLRAAAPRSVVPFADPAAPGAAEGGGGGGEGAGAEAAPAVVEAPLPRNVAILTDGMTVSAAEAFVLRAMRSRKVTLFGRPTGGSIDYQNVGIVRFGCPDAGLYVGYPTIIGSDRLPEGGVRPTGIVPDVPLETSVGDPIARVVENYRSPG